MTSTGRHTLKGECGALVAQAHALLSSAHRLDPGMAVFVRAYLTAVEQDFEEAIRLRTERREAQLALIADELLDLVVDLRCRREKSIKAFARQRMTA